MSARVVVTGAARGIGAAISTRLEADGYEVIRVDANAGDGGPGDVVVCDIADPSAVDAVAAEIGPVDALVNNAGIWRFGPLEDISPGEFASVLDVNVRGTFHCTQAFGRPMLDRSGGAIVNIVSIAGYRANPAVGSYGPSKAALISLTEQTALEWGPRGVRCNAVGPGLIPTPGSSDVYDDPAVHAARSGAIPLRRLGEPSDIADVVWFVLSNDARYVTGQTIFVDGGLSKGLMTMLPRPADIAQP